mgnify:CR=1 FL=1
MCNISLGNQVSHITTLSFIFLFQIHALRSFKHSFQMCFDGILVLEMKEVEPCFSPSCISLNRYKTIFFHIKLSKFPKGTPSPKISEFNTFNLACFHHKISGKFLLADLFSHQLSIFKNSARKIYFIATLRKF